MLSKFLGIVILVNVVVFMWPQASTDDLAHVYPPRVDVNARLIRLNKEIEEDRTVKQNLEAVKQSLVPPPDDVQNCYRLGPFSQATNFDIAKATLLNASIDFIENRRAVNRSEVYRVYLGPFNSRAQAIDARTELSHKGILDHFVRDEVDGSVIVSLGIFTSQETADLGLEQVLAKHSGAKLRPEVVTLPQTDWLYFSLKDNPQVFGQLNSIDWGEAGAQLGAYPCQQ